MLASVGMLPGVRMRRTLRLAKDVFFCVSEDHGIFLDLKGDAYSAVRLCGASRDARTKRDAATTIAARLSGHRRDLMAAGLLGFDGGGSAIDAFLAIPGPERHIFGPYAGRTFGQARGAEFDVRASLEDALAVFVACRRASSWLRRRSLCELVHRLRDRRATARANLRMGGAGYDLAELRRETAKFRKLRPWYPRAYLCLFEAVALLEYLAARNHFPACIFAVQAEPFGAHCWVQAGATLLNESLEYAGRFTPIMSI